MIFPSGENTMARELVVPASKASKYFCISTPFRCICKQLFCCIYILTKKQSNYQSTWSEKTDLEVIQNEIENYTKAIADAIKNSY